jgi:hypothetical protein
MPSQSRKSRGMATQALVAAWYRLRGFPYATSTGSGRSGVDIENMLGPEPEVKATAGDPPLEGLRQAHRRRRPGGIPYVVWRPNGYGPERMAEWPVLMRLDDHTELLRDAGYGDDSATCHQCGQHRTADQRQAAAEGEGL